MFTCAHRNPKNGQNTLLAIGFWNGNEWAQNILELETWTCTNGAKSCYTFREQRQSSEENKPKKRRNLGLLLLLFMELETGNGSKPTTVEKKSELNLKNNYLTEQYVNI